MVNMGGNNDNPGPSQQGGYPGNSYREAHQSYVVFVSEPNDKKSELRRAKEVNTVIPAIPKAKPKIWGIWALILCHVVTSNISPKTRRIFFI